MDLLNAEYVSFFSCAHKFQLRYMVIGGYAVNYYGYNRNTHDLDIWLAPNNNNRDAFIKTLLCMGYSDNEVSPLLKEDFTKHFVASIGNVESSLDFLTIVHQNIIFDEAEKTMLSHKLTHELNINFVPYNFLIDMKLLARREKDLLDISQLDKLKNIKK